MSTEQKLSRSWVLGSATLAFGVALGLGYYIASGSASDAVSETSDGTGLSLLYKIPVTSSQPATGPEDALVTIVQWCNLPDPACKQAEPALQAVRKRYAKEVRVVFRHFVDPAEPGSGLSHQFARVAHEQGSKFWEARQLLLDHQGPVTHSTLEGFATALGLDWAAVKKALDAGTYGGPVTSDRIFAGMFDVKSTPAFFANGRPLLGKPTQSALEALVKEELERAKQAVATGVDRAVLYAELTKHGTWNPPMPPPARAR